MKLEIARLESHGCGSLQSGQAMIEVLVGIVALIVLIAGLLQVASLSSGQTGTMVTARKKAGDNAMNGGEVASVPDYIKDWQVSSDKKHYTADDTFSPADANQFEGTIIEHAAIDSSGWTIYIDSIPPDHNMFTTIHKSGTPQYDLGLVEGHDSTNVYLLPVIQDLVYGADSITIDSKVWMTWTTGIYGQGK
jgi:hypothetical protein